QPVWRGAAGVLAMAHLARPAGAAIDGAHVGVRHVHHLELDAHAGIVARWGRGLQADGRRASVADVAAEQERGVERAKLATLIATILGSSIAFVDASVVNIALPAIGRDLDANLGQLQWVALSYSLAVASLYIVSGALGDRYGRRRLFVLGVAGFA